MYVRGTEGTAIVRDWGSDVEIVRCTQWSDHDIKPVKTASGLSKTMAPRSERTIENYTVPKDHVLVHDFYRNFCDVIDKKAELIVTHDQMRVVMKVIEASFESARTENTVFFK